jgi:hypothetical protein
MIIGNGMKKEEITRLIKEFGTMDHPLMSDNPRLDSLWSDLTLDESDFL